LTPSLVLLLLILVGPFFYMVGASFTDLSFSIPGRDGNFVGFDNYRRLVRDDPVFWSSFLLTLRFVVWAVAVEFVLGFALALLLYHHVRRRRFLLTGLLVPMMLAPVAVGLIWKLLLQGDFGMLTYYLRAVGVIDLRTALLSSPDLVLATIVAIDVWQWTPFVTLVMLAGLLSLPREPFEAAVMDGARPYQVFRDVTLPLLRPIVALVLLLRGIDAFKEFDKVFILTGGGPGSATELLSIYAYRVNFKNWDLGYGAVCAFMVYLVVLILCSVFYKAAFWGQAQRKRAGGRAA
ncbi:MAG TPA: sugar ABC transporter permease, partial [Dongiaceae bacterium]|nr:sugar ABC transporter permease [Dongiaceae bacterium]